jgi:hypothetical protein
MLNGGGGLKQSRACSRESLPRKRESSEAPHLIRLGLISIIVLLLWPLTPAYPLYLNLDFSVDRQTYNWADSLSLSQSLSPKSSFQFSNRSYATLFQESVFGQGGDRWQKTALTRAALDYQVHPRFRTGISISQDFDRLEEKRFIGTRVLATSLWDNANLTWKQGGGVVWEERSFEPRSNSESGFAYESEFKIRPRSSLRWGQGRITGELTSVSNTPRRSIGFGYELPQLVINDDTLAVTGWHSFARRDYFPSTDFESTARQTSEQRRWDLSVGKHLIAHTRLLLSAAYRYDRYDYEYEGAGNDLLHQNDNLTSIFEYRLSLQKRFGQQLSLETNYLFNRTDEDFGSDQTNQLAETGQLTTRLLLTQGDRDSLELSGQIGVTSYFAPTTSAYFSDRDRSIKVAALRVVHQFSEFLTAGLDGSYRGFHTVYISGELSANNNINNVYIVNPMLVWRPFAAVRLQQNYQMHANYTYYQYEKDAVSLRNTLYRRANFVNNLSISLSPRTDLIIEYSYRYEDFGRLLWEDQWKQQVSWDRRTHRPRFGVDFHPWKGFRFYPYASYEIQSSYDHLFDADAVLGRRAKSDELSRKLIGFELLWTLSLNSYVECKLERRVQEYQRQRSQDYDFFTISVKRIL